MRDLECSIYKTVFEGLFRNNLSSTVPRLIPDSDSKQPRPVGCKRLIGREGWRIRVGSFRIIYEIDDTAKSVIILHIGHRKDVYR